MSQPEVECIYCDGWRTVCEHCGYPPKRCSCDLFSGWYVICPACDMTNVVELKKIEEEQRADSQK